MPMKTILVSLNEAQRSNAVMDVAENLAVKFDAHLIGLYAIPTMPVYPGIAFHYVPDIFDVYRELHVEKAKEIQQQFEKRRQRTGFSGEWRQAECETASITETVLSHAYQADLVMTSQVNQTSAAGIDVDFCERLVLGSGRPSLFVPYAGPNPSIGERVIIGWNGTREAARAVFDALPFLIAAKEVHIIWVDAKREQRDTGDLPGAELATCLSRHGITPLVDSITTDDLNVEDVLLNRAAELGADLLVMGAYGHSRVREFLLGGATRGILAQMTLPVIMAH